MNQSELAFERDGDTIRGFAAWPQSSAPLPGLVVIPDVFGLYEHYRDLARRFADQGFFTFAIDLYSREGTPKLPDFEAVFRWIDALPDQRILADLEAAARFVAARPEVSGRKVGITGFCMGGQYATMAVCVSPSFAACVSWYGMLRYRENPPHKPASPLQLAPRINCPYLGLFGAEDAIVPLADVEELRTILARTGKPFEVRTYANAGHAFFNDTRPEMYRPDAAADAWTRTLGFFRQHLRAA